MALSFFLALQPAVPYSSPPPLISEGAYRTRTWATRGPRPVYGVQVKPGGAAWRPSDPRHTPMYPQPERPPQITRRVLLSDVRRHGDSAEQRLAGRVSKYGR